VPRRDLVLARVVFVVTCIALFTGTVVTAAGPHGGDEDVERLSWPLPNVARVHGITVAVLTVLALLLVARAHRDDVPARFRIAVFAFAAALVAQAVIGYVQYFNGVPALLVGIHVTGAVIVFSLATTIQLEMYERAVTADVGDVERVSTPVLA
jgi:cytochrome c oxidase assembly protein subunit 15